MEVSKAQQQQQQTAASTTVPAAIKIVPVDNEQEHQQAFGYDDDISDTDSGVDMGMDLCVVGQKMTVHQLEVEEQIAAMQRQQQAKTTGSNNKEQQEEQQAAPKTVDLEIAEENMA